MFRLEMCSFISQYLMKLEICNVMMSITLALRGFFGYIFLIINHLITKLGQLIGIFKGNAFWNYFKSFGGLAPNSRHFLI